MDEAVKPKLGTCCEMMIMALAANGNAGIRLVPVVVHDDKALSSLGRMKGVLAYRMRLGKANKALLLRLCPWCGADVAGDEAPKTACLDVRTPGQVANA